MYGCRSEAGEGDAPSFEALIRPRFARPPSPASREKGRSCDRKPGQRIEQVHALEVDGDRRAVALADPGEAVDQRAHPRPVAAGRKFERGVVDADAIAVEPRRPSV